MSPSFPSGYWRSLVFSSGKSSFFEAFLRSLLVPPSWAWAAVVRARNRAYDRGIFPAHRAAVPVISIGNASLGGTGKTALAMECASLLLAQGKRPVLLSRGYGRSSPGEIRAVSDGNKILLDARGAGDEPLLLARRLPTVPVVVGADRVRAARWIAERFRPDCILLDDGFQHRRLERDLDIAALDENASRAPYVFPRGYLREGLESMGRADFWIFKGGGSSRDWKARLKSLAPSLDAEKPAAVFGYKPLVLVESPSGRTQPLERLKAQPVVAVSALAHPESFEESLRAAGAALAEVRRFPDHHFYGVQDLDALAALARRLGALLVATEKDAVKFPETFPVWTLRAGIEWREGRADLEKMILEIFR